MTVERARMEADIVCVGFGPAAAGFLETLGRGMTNPDGTPAMGSSVMPGMPLQVLCYERSDGIGFGVSGVATRATAIRESLSGSDFSAIPMCTPITEERLVYLLDPGKASQRSWILKSADTVIRALRGLNPFYEEYAMRLPVIPPFLNKHGGIVMSIGQFTAWAGERVMALGAVQVWPGMPAAEPIITAGRVAGVRLTDQGVDKKGNPGPGYMPGMDVHASLTVVADGPVGPVGRMIDEKIGMPSGHHRREWAVGAKLVVDLPSGHGLKTGSVIHTFGYPEPEIFGFLYVHPGNVASLGIFVPSTWGNPVRTSYRYLQHWMTHPYLWRYLDGGVMRSWGTKSLQESGRRGEPYLAGEGYARIGEGSGSTNVLSGSGVDEAWATGVQLAEAVLELLREGRPFTKENLDRTYVKRRRASRMDAGSRTAARSRDGFGLGFLAGLVGMGLAGFTRGLLSVPAPSVPPHRRVRSIVDWFRGRIPREEVDKLLRECRENGVSLHDAFMDRAGWPRIEYDGKLLVSQQDALLMGGKVQAPDGFADHVIFLNPDRCRACESKVCVEMCSGEAITPGEGGVPAFDREKCVHCGVCLWNCAAPRDGNPESANTDFRAGAGGLHSGEN